MLPTIRQHPEHAIQIDRLNQPICRHVNYFCAHRLHHPHLAHALYAFLGSIINSLLHCACANRLHQSHRPRAMGAETSTPTAGTGEVDGSMEAIIRLLHEEIDFQQSRPGATPGRPYPDPLQQDRLHQPPYLSEYQAKAWEKQAEWAKTVKFKIAEGEYLSQADWEREEVERNMMFDNDGRLLAHMVQSMHHPCVGLMFELLLPGLRRSAAAIPRPWLR